MAAKSIYAEDGLRGISHCSLPQHVWNRNANGLLQGGMCTEVQSHGIRVGSAGYEMSATWCRVLPVAPLFTHTC